MAKNTRYGDNVAVWSRFYGFQAGVVESTETLLARVTAAENTFQSFFVGDGVVVNHQAGPLRECYDNIQALLQSPDLSSGQRSTWDPRSQVTIRLIYFDTIRARFQQVYASQIAAGYAAVGLPAPNFSANGSKVRPRVYCRVRSQARSIGTRGGDSAAAHSHRRATGARKPIHSAELDRMTGHHLSSSQGGAILVAVVGLVVGAVDVAAAHEPSKSEAPASDSVPAGAAPTCHAWAEATRRRTDRLGEQAWHDVTIKALVHACGAIPEQLRRAAGEVQEVKDPAENARILAAAASATLAAGCAVPEPLADSRQVARTCPLPSNLPANFPYGLGEAELTDLRAVDYVTINALLRSLITANQFDEAVQMVILDFALSSQINGEAFRRREERRHRRSR